MKTLLTLLTCLLILSPNVVMSETWVCGYEVYGNIKLLRLERTPKGFKQTSPSYGKPTVFSVHSETKRRIVLITDYEEGVFVTILDKKNSEFILSGVYLPEQLRRGGANMDTHTFKFNQGKCEILDK